MQVGVAAVEVALELAGVARQWRAGTVERTGRAVCRCAVRGARAAEAGGEGDRQVRLLPRAPATPRDAMGYSSGLSQTEMWLGLPAVNGAPRQSPQRSRRRSPARRAIRSSSAGQT